MIAACCSTPCARDPTPTARPLAPRTVICILGAVVLAWASLYKGADAREVRRPIPNTVHTTSPPSTLFSAERSRAVNRLLQPHFPRALSLQAALVSVLVGVSFLGGLSEPPAGLWGECRDTEGASCLRHVQRATGPQALSSSHHPAAPPPRRRRPRRAVHVASTFAAAAAAIACAARLATRPPAPSHSRFVAVPVSDVSASRFRCVGHECE